jgi:hypothetical protein
MMKAGSLRDAFGLRGKSKLPGNQLKAVAVLALVTVFVYVVGSWLFQSSSYATVPQVTCAGLMATLGPGNPIIAWAHKPKKEAFCVFLHDLRLDEWLSREIMHIGYIEEPLLDRIEAEIKRLAIERPGKDIHFMDIGGNIGYLSLFAASVHPSVKVTVVEPFGWHANLLERSIAVNGLSHRVKLMRVAAGDKVCTT